MGAGMRGTRLSAEGIKKFGAVVGDVVGVANCVGLSLWIARYLCKVLVKLEQTFRKKVDFKMQLRTRQSSVNISVISAM